LLGPVDSVQALSSIGFADRVATAEGPRKGSRISVETPTTVMALIRFASGADIVLTMSWDVWKHGHPPIELYGADGSLRVPDPNFFGGMVEITQGGADWQVRDSSDRPYGKPNWRSPSWPADAPDRANYRCLGIAELASSVFHGTPHRSSGMFAAHVLEVMHAILVAGRDGGTARVASRIDRPPALSDEEARSYWRGQTH
jgi:predicted dehydrogenase